MKADKALERWPCDWDSHELQQLRRGASRTFRENLIWLEETSEFVKRFQKLNEVAPSPTPRE